MHPAMIAYMGTEYQRQFQNQAILGSLYMQWDLTHASPGRQRLARGVVIYR